MELRLNKYLAERIGISRREADEAIAAGKVTIDGRPAVLGARITLPSTGDDAGGGPPREPSGGGEASAGPVEIRYNGKLVPFKTNFLYVAMNKPVGYVCSRRAQGENPTIYDLLPREYKKLKTVGRLDKDSSGLILLTNDGDFAYQMTHPKFRKEKIYEVTLDRPLEPLHQQMISDYGIMLEDGPSKFKIIHDNNSTYTVILSEGRNRQIRRTFAALGYHVIKLHRTNFGKYQLSGLKPRKCVIIKP